VDLTEIHAVIRKKSNLRETKKFNHLHRCNNSVTLSFRILARRFFQNMKERQAIIKIEPFSHIAAYYHAHARCEHVLFLATSLCLSAQNLENY